MGRNKLQNIINQCIETSETVLNLSNKYITTLPPEIFNLSNLQTLYLNNNQLTTLPSEIRNLSNLQTLDLSGNQLTILPPEIGNISNMQTFNLSDNQLTTLPSEILNLSNLEKLYLSGNQLTTLPPEILNLSNLRVLYLDKNQLSTIPPEIVNLSNLRFLNLSENQLTTIPPKIGNLSNLQWLKLSGNQLTTIPSKIGNLSNLQWLDLNDNQLITLPPEIVNLSNLQTFSLRSNPLTIPQPEIVRQGTKAILSYLRNLLEAKAKRYEAKLLILGDGGEGKTCLSRALRGLPFAYQRSTQGVDVEPWEFQHPVIPDKRVTLNIWDFEGQEINHQSHQFFLTNRSLYIVVFNGRKQFDYGHIEYWLDTIRTRAPQSIVIIVATECGKATPSIPIDRLKAQYGDILKTSPFYFTTECNNSIGIIGIPELQKLIKECIADKDIMPLMGELWPQSYAKVEKTIKDMANQNIPYSKSHIARTELHDIYKREGIPEEDYGMVSSIMGDMGIITHFPGSSDLYEFVVLKPHWLTKAISNVMEHKDLEENKGERTQQWLKSIWDKEYPGLLQIFHNAMKEFELCYDLDNPDQSILVPLRFGYEKPYIPWKNSKEQERTIQYRFDVTPPAGIMSRFIVKTHHMIVKPYSKSKGIYWYNGVFLETDMKTGNGSIRSEALCEFDKEARTLNITVRAAFPQNMIEQLNGFAQAVFSFFEGLKPKRYYGCFKEDGSQCNGFHSEEDIMFILSKDKPEIHCSKGLHSIAALKLITGITSFADSVSVKDELKQLFREKLEEKTPELSMDISKDISRDVSSVIARVEALSDEIFRVKKDLNEMPAEVTQKVQLTFRDYLNLFDDMLEISGFTPIPSLISIIHVNNKSILKINNLFEIEFILAFYCEYDKGIHKTDYHLDFNIPKEWWRKTLPVAGLLFDTLRGGLKAAPYVVSLVDLTLWAGMQTPEIKSALFTMDKLFKWANEANSKALENLGEMPNIDGTVNDFTYDLRSKAFREDTEFRQVRLQLADLLKGLDPESYKARKWGELERLKMKDNSFRWLCKQHADEYRRMF
ncbi:MAG: leucine-rich repeat domain-containing protein [Nitrospirae bacterium]|nr:leucine-rich repeat domain-containing protein [Nitrospirota bacterium]